MKIFKIIKYVVIIVLALILHFISMNPPKRIYKTNIINTIESGNLVEDFNDGLNTQFWNTLEQGNNSNDELQYYSPSNLIIEDGILNIEARKEEFNNHQYTSALINTKNKFEFLYGKIIFKIKSAVGKGVLSAIWLLPSDNSLYPELDIIEILGENNKKVWTGIHYLDIDLKQNKNFNTYIGSDDFDTYELNWEENEIKCYLNNNLVYKTNSDIPNKKMYLTINLSVGGIWPKEPDDSIFPTNFLIDYIIVIPKRTDA